MNIFQGKSELEDISNPTLRQIPEDYITWRKEGSNLEITETYCQCRLLKTEFSVTKSELIT